MNVGGHTSLLSPDDCQTAIDEVMFEEFTRTSVPGYLSARDSFFFKTDSTDSMAFIYDEDSNVGQFQFTEEQEEILNTDTIIGNQTNVGSRKYTKQVPISDEAFRADQVGKRDRIGRQVGDRARLTQDSEAILRTYGDAFAGTFYNTPDGVSTANNSHVLLGTNGTLDNLELGSLNADNAWVSVTSLANQRGQDGDAGSHVFEGFLCPFTLYKTAKETFNSQLVPFSAENQVNIFDTDYGTIRIYASIFLGSTYNSAANANTSTHYISRNHMFQRKVFYGLTTDLIPPTASANDVYLHRSKFHEVAFPGSWTGYVGNNGTV